MSTESVTHKLPSLQRRAQYNEGIRITTGKIGETLEYQVPENVTREPHCRALHVPYRRLGQLDY